MSKYLKIHDETYNRLDALKVGRQTFSDVIDDLLNGRNTILEAMNMLEGILRFREWQRQQIEKLSQR